jgi:hypothetical protein
MYIHREKVGMADAQPAIEENIQESSKCIDGE